MTPANRFGFASREGETLLLADDCEKPFMAGDVARFAEGDIHGIRNDSQNEIEYISVTSPPMDFGYAYKDKR